MNTVEALKELYKSFGGKLTDTYSNIADGIPVGNYSVIPDCFAALAEIAGGSIELPVVTQADAGDVLTVGEDGKWTNEEPVKEVPTVTASDNGKVLSVFNGKWSKEVLIAKREATVTLSDTATSMDFSLGSVGNKTPVGIQVSDMTTQYKLANVNFKTEMVFSLNPNANNYVRLTAPEGSTFQAGTYKIFIIYLNQDNLGVF